MRLQNIHLYIKDRKNIVNKFQEKIQKSAHTSKTVQQTTETKNKNELSFLTCHRVSKRTQKTVPPRKKNNTKLNHTISYSFLEQKPQKKNREIFSQIENS
uniref:Uncharacterized protein n=1 Tax=Cacopsylla melanoneura TaxID=428564 RepID=A0A8D9F7W3_9HEMI